MRLIKQNIERKDGSGSATLLPEEPEDMVRESVLLQHPQPSSAADETSGMPTT